MKLAAAIQWQSLTQRLCGRDGEMDMARSVGPTDRTDPDR